MFARHNQENLTHTHLTAAASKPLNAQPKTPFRSRNDENTTQATAKGKAALLFTTPTATRPRAVLGAKTTNAKALATPGPNGAKTQKPVGASAQKISPRLKKTKVRIHAPVVETEEPEDDVPDVEYCPPPGVVTPPLDYRSDGFDEFIQSDMCSQENVLRSALVGGPWDQNRADRELERARLLLEDALNEELEGDLGLEHMSFDDEELEGMRRDAVAKRYRDRKGPGTLNSKSAANALGGLGEKKVPSFAAPTKSTQLRAEVRGLDKENAVHRFSNAKATSKTTMGYSRGRQVSATKRTPLSNAHKTPVVKVAPKKEGARTRKLEDVVKPVSPPAEGGDERERNWVDEEIERLACEDFVLDL